MKLWRCGHLVKNGHVRARHAQRVCGRWVSVVFCRVAGAGAAFAPRCPGHVRALEVGEEWQAVAVEEFTEWVRGRRVFRALQQRGGDGGVAQ